MAAIPGTLPGGTAAPGGAAEWTMTGGGSFAIILKFNSSSGGSARILVDGAAQGADTVIPSQEEEGDSMPAHVVTPYTIPLSTAAATRVDILAPATPAAKRYKVTVVNTGVDRIYVGFSNTVTTTTGICVEPDFGQAEFFIDSNVQLWAIRGGSTTVNVRSFESETA